MNEDVVPVSNTHETVWSRQVTKAVIKLTVPAVSDLPRVKLIKYI